MYTKTLALTGLAALASAHMKISNPVPFDKSNLDNGPLAADGSNFPCKYGGKIKYALEGASNVYAQGSTQKLSFIGSAVHGGGSCQISVTGDLNPTKDSVWKVIKSIEGGCPAKSTAGNLAEAPNADSPFSYDFTIPKELEARNYTLAWTWFNKIGNREMYMNCAPLTVTGSGGSKDFMNSLPDMLVANVGNKCETVEGTDVIFPNPGKDVDNFGGSTLAAQMANTAKPVLNGACQSVMNPGGNPGGNNGAPKPTAAPGSQSTSIQNSQSAVPTNNPTISAPGGVFITKSQPAQSQPAQSQPQQSGPAITSVNAPQPTATNGSSPAPTDGSGGGNGPAGGFAAGTACTTEGAWNCISGTSFQRCASGTWSIAQKVAAGTSCSPGQASELKMAVTKNKRAFRRAMRFSA
ncbi:hypothetical protein QQS21_004325 [Conoideocrella luteorostrata]|uniref:Uncharacterized protein n=1 Tax=Conoideocrella luteorostrata TaxID=1105319 RepID=A0AAJ0CSH6_9HYPO|nr:hypothetical protein QQS21_004325 [Conoideocrella luteorostrata]